MILQNGETLINCLAYIDLNPVCAALVDCPDDYRWNSLGHHVQTREEAEPVCGLDGLYSLKRLSEA